MGVNMTERAPGMEWVGMRDAVQPTAVLMRALAESDPAQRCQDGELCSRKHKLTYSDRKQISDCLGTGGEDGKGRRGLRGAQGNLWRHCKPSWS